MIHSSYTALLFGAVALVGFGASVPKAIAQTTYPFEATYNAEITNKPIAPNISESFDVGESVDAPYGLTNIMNMTYAEFDPNTSVFRFDSDPAAIGLEGLPVGTFTFFGSGSDRLLGRISGSASIDFENLVGTGSSTITIFDGEGRFTDASGILELSENATLSPDPTAPISSEFRISGSFQTPEAVPEPKADATLVAIGLIGGTFLLRRYRNGTM